jgi:hypothetical protein
MEPSRAYTLPHTAERTLWLTLVTTLGFPPLESLEIEKHRVG